ncbi:tripartite tricarboxylate transporter substrate binding protein [Bordetella sp. BOR01]|uniref:Bug family tripartite tricarboxylate transporter substrate binding protein n=1 Tax=Bordetella sp. BOR01 TaxID=2854779 RepID=UPI001C46C489|nr:tripartite tricarboxylate transporter substrate binding protein [Bordetella sp. BOR01]MBV7486534.1 tripartite tricarboxylate transporter substrate binding protein [Bordetella sp. BOR01]
MHRRLSRRSFSLFMLSLAATGPVFASSGWPDKPVRVIIPFPAGGSSDGVMRIVGERLAAQLGVPVVIENKPGASTQLGTEFVARSAADGQTLLFGSSTAFTVLPHLRKSLRFDPQHDFTAIGSIAEYLGVAAARKELGTANFAEFVAAAKQAPGKLTFGSPGVGTLGHIQGEIIKRDAGIDMLHVPFKGSSDAATALAGGQIDFLIDAAVVPYVQGGRVVPLFTFGDKRRAEVPDVPPITELGLDVQRPTGPTWGLFSPQGTSKAIVERLAAALRHVMAEPATQQQLSGIGATPRWMDGHELMAAFASDSAFFGRLLPAIGITPEG